MLNLLVLSHLVEEHPADRIERTLRLFGARLEQVGRGVPLMAAALSTYVAGVQQIVIVGDEGRLPLEHAVARRHLPFAVTLGVPSERTRQLVQTLPFVGAMKPVEGKAAVYVCRDFTCRAPVTEIDELNVALGASNDVSASPDVAAPKDTSFVR